MKKYWLALVAVAMIFVGCDKGPDAREAFVGTYTYTTDGSLTIYGSEPGQESTLPLVTDGTFKIEKKGEKDSVLILGPIAMVLDSLEATVKGNQLQVVKNEYSIDAQGVSLTITLDNTKAPLVNDSLKWETGVQCKGTLFMTEITGDGNLILNAKRQALEADK